MKSTALRLGTILAGLITVQAAFAQTVYRTDSNASSPPPLHAYDVATDSWSVLATLPDENTTQLAASETTLYALPEDGNVYAYNPGTDAWDFVFPGPAAAVGNNNISMLETLNGEFYWAKDNTVTLHYTVGGTWTSITAPADLSSAADFDTATGILYIRVYGELGHLAFDTATQSFGAGCPDATTVGENNRTGVFYAGQFYSRTDSGNLIATDVASCSQTDTGVALSTEHSSSVVDANGNIYLNGYGESEDTFEVFSASTNSVQLLASAPDLGGGNEHSTLSMLRVPTGAPDPRATFQVNKTFNDGNTTEVEVTLSCNTGLPLEQSTDISEGDGVTFVVVDFSDGEMDCTVTETAGADGYSVSYFDGSTTSDDGCTFEDVAFGNALSCRIDNTLDQVEVEVTKVWIDENPQFNAQNVAGATWTCSNVAFPCELGFVNGCDSGTLDFFGNPGVDAFSVFPDWEDGTTCSITEVNLLESGIEVDDSECQGLVVFPGVGASCTIFNTRLFEGIPTLSQYGLGILALLMLGVGFVAFRRVI